MWTFYYLIYLSVLGPMFKSFKDGNFVINLISSLVILCSIFRSMKISSI